MMHKLLEVAKKDIGKKEKSGNSGFFDEDLEKRMRAVGWIPGWAWCACIQEVWVWEAFPELKEKVKGLFVPSAVKTYENLIRAGYNHSMMPTIGSLVYWQKMSNGKPLWQGHAGVTSKVISHTEFYSIEGNTSNTGSRNGDTVLDNRRIVKNDVKDGLRVIGFVTLF